MYPNVAILVVGCAGREPLVSETCVLPVGLVSASTSNETGMLVIPARCMDWLVLTMETTRGKV